MEIKRMERALIDAVRNNNIEEVRRLLDAGANVHAEDDRAFRTIAFTRNIDLNIVRLLLERGANVHAGGEMVLEQACIHGNRDLVRLLLENGADIHVRGDSPLFSSIENIEIVRLLLENGANANALLDDPDIMEEIQGNADLMALLREYGLEEQEEKNERLVVAEARVSYQTLLNAAENNNIEEAKRLLENEEVDADARNIALELACMNGNINIVRLLVEHGADVNAMDAAVLTTVNRYYAELAAFLREHGVEVAARQERGRDVPLSDSEDDEEISTNRHQERRRIALEQERKNEQLRAIAIDEVKNREEKASENPFIEANCSSTDSLYGDPLKDADDIVVFEIGGNKGDCYLKTELKLLQSDQYVRGVGEKAYKLPWSNVWITKSLKEFAERLEGHGPIPLQRSDNFVGYNRSNVLWVLREE